jgi:hypothetical protein
VIPTPMSRGSICTDFPGIAPVLWALQSQMSQVFASHKNYLSDDASRHFDSLVVGIPPDVAAGNNSSKAFVVRWLAEYGGESELPLFSLHCLCSCV